MGSKFPVEVRAGSRERGVITIFIAMMMLLLITVMVVAAFSLSTTNLRVVSNVQAREGGIDAAMFIIERTMQAPFYLSPVAELDQPVDLNNDAQTDYLVDLAVPTCVRAVRAATAAASSVTLPGMSASGAYDTIWELEATATQPATGMTVQVLQAVRILLSEANKNLLCTGP